MSSSTESHAHENGVVHAAPSATSDRNARLLLAVYAGASAGLRAFTLPATAMRVRDNAWAPLFASFARAEIIVDKLPDTPSRLRPDMLIARAVVAGASAAALATRKDPAWLPLAGAAVATAMASAWIGATIRTKGAEKNVPDFVLAAIEDQVAFHWAKRAFPEIEKARPEVPATKTFSLL